MKKVLVTIVALFLFVGISQAQNKMYGNIGGNVLLPMGDFGDAANIRIWWNSSIRNAIYASTPWNCTAGYITWGGKDAILG